MAAFRSDKDMVARAYGHLIERPLPHKWIAQIDRGRADRRRPFLPVLAALAASLALLIAGSAVFSPLAPRSVVADALSARDNSLHPIAVIHAAVGLRAASDVLARTLALKLRAPDLSEMGYSLAAIQIYPAASSGDSIELIYRRSRSEDFTLFIRRATGQPRFDVFERDG